MSRKLTLTLLLMFCLSIFLKGTSSADTSKLQVDRPTVVPGEVFVKFKEGVTSDQIADVNRQVNAQTARFFAFIQVYLLKLPQNLTVTDALSQLRAHPLVEYAEPNNLYYLDVTTPNDPDFGQLWGLNNTGQGGGTPDADIDAPEAWDITTGSNNVVIAVIDSGVDMNHPDLAANIWTNRGETPGNGVDDDGNGYIDDVNGWDFSANDNDPSPAGGACGGHGTHVAGTIGALGNNGTGVVGVNWNVKIMPIKAFRPVLGILCSASDADLIASIEYHTMMGVPVSSNSWGGSSANLATYNAIRASNSVFVAAAGNEGRDNDSSSHYPSNYDLDNIIAVAATDRNDNRAGFSNYGVNSVDLGAPGVDIYSTLRNGSYGSLSGTSMATPHVSGVAGLLLAQDFGLTINEIKWRILNGTDNIGLPVLSGGRLNANSALQFGLSTPAVTVDITPLSSTDVSPGDSISFRISVTNNTGSSINTRAKAYARLDDGREFSSNSATASLNPDQTVSRDVPITVPAGAPIGTTFQIFGQAETTVSFDENWERYTVIP